jgi:hypothetical protein
MAGEITSLEFTYAAGAAAGCQTARCTLAGKLAHVRPERIQELLDDLRAAAEQLTTAAVSTRIARCGRLSVVTGARSGRDMP